MYKRDEDYIKFSAVPLYLVEQSTHFARHWKCPFSVTGEPGEAYSGYSVQPTAKERSYIIFPYCLAPNGSSLKRLNMTFFLRHRI